MAKRPAREIAIHEAGHAVASYRLGFLPARVDITQSAGALGHFSDDPTFSLSWGDDRVLSPQETAEAAAVVCYAGLAAEAHFGFAAYCWRPGTLHGAWEDDRLAREEFPDNIGVPRLHWRTVANCRKRAVRLIAAHADDVDQVARALVRFRSLCDAEIEAVLGVASVAAAHGAELLAARRRGRKGTLPGPRLR